jgi:Na+/alanine symporter
MPLFEINLIVKRQIKLLYPIFKNECFIFIDIFIVFMVIFNSIAILFLQKLFKWKN